MSTKPPENIEKMDWRINNLTWTTAPFTVPNSSTIVPAGCAIAEAALIHVGKERVGISIPNATALFLNLSQKSHEEASKWAKQSLANKGKVGQLPDNLAFAFYECIMASVVFANTSLEAFVNEEVPDTYVFSEPDSRCTRQYNKWQIERHLNLDTKLGDVLPAVLNVKTPKGGNLWNAYTKLRELRDRIIHMKTKDRMSLGKDQSSIWHALLNDPLPETYTTAKKMMKYFFDAKGKHPRWLEKCPF